MRKAKAGDNKPFETHTRPSFQRVSDAIPTSDDIVDARRSYRLKICQELVITTSGPKAFRNHVRELKRLEAILQSGRKGRDPNVPDVYDRMVLERRGIKVEPSYDFDNIRPNGERARAMVRLP